MTRDTVEKIEKEMLDALSRHHKSEENLNILARRYRIAKFGPDYKNPEPAEGDTCSFCAKSEKDVEKFVAGPNVFICNECIDLSHEIIHEE